MLSELSLLSLPLSKQVFEIIHFYNINVNLNSLKLALNGTRLIRFWIIAQNAVDCLEQRISLASAAIAEIIQIQRPYHGAAKFHGAGQLGFTADDVDVVKRNPLVSAMSVRTHGTFGILNDGPSTIFE